ncbi:MAG TPA: VOC family protein [Chryseosolibacter sp.]|nr:VOC family protein [Chryseosolibacter sp.]
MEFLRIKETCIYIQDLEKARHFYQGTLGLPVINYAEGKHLFLRVGESVLLLFNPEDSKYKTSPPAHFGGGKQHFAFEVRNYEECKRQVREKGIEIIDELTWQSGKRSFYFNDPEGNVLEILPKKGIWD